MDIGYTLFDSPIGRCGLAWNEHAILALQLPEADDRRTRERMLRRLGAAAAEGVPPAWVLEAQKQINALLSGEARDLSSIELDMTRIPAFDRAVYEIARGIGPGKTLTYGEVAARLPDGVEHAGASLAQSVGAALGRNPYAIIVPCHRVLAAGGKTGGFSARGGPATKLRMLAIEGALDRGTLFE